MIRSLPLQPALDTLFARLTTWLPAGLLPAAMVARGVNFLLLRNPWAMQRLAAYAGRRLVIEWGQQSFQFVLTEGGLLQPYEGGQQAVQVRLIVPRDQWLQMGSSLLQQQPEQFAEQLRIEGDVGFARVLAELAGQLRWDAEADVAQFTGDILAVRIVQGAQGTLRWAQRVATQLQANLGEYLGHESELLTHQDYWSLWQRRQQQLEAQLNQVEARLKRLESHTI